MNWNRILSTVAVCFPFTFGAAATFALAVTR